MSDSLITDECFRESGTGDQPSWVALTRVVEEHVVKLSVWSAVTWEWAEAIVYAQRSLLLLWAGNVSASSEAFSMAFQLDWGNQGRSHGVFYITQPKKACSVWFPSSTLVQVGKELQNWSLVCLFLCTQTPKCFIEPEVFITDPLHVSEWETSCYHVANMEAIAGIEKQ